MNIPIKSVFYGRLCHSLEYHTCIVVSAYSTSFPDQLLTSLSATPVLNEPHQNWATGNRLPMTIILSCFVSVPYPSLD